MKLGHQQHEFVAAHTRYGVCRTYDAGQALADCFEQLIADATALGETAKWLKEQDLCQLTLWNGMPLTVTPPNFVIMTVTATDPGLKGDTSSGGSKSATLETGASVRVPLFIQTGDVIKVDTRNGEYVSRAKE